MKFSTSALFLFIVSSSVNVVKSQEDGDGPQNFLDMVNTTLTYIDDAFDCETEAQAIYDANPALDDAWSAWENSYAYTSTSSDSTAPGSADKVTVSYDADALVAYESACTAVGDSVAWIALPPTDFSCVADDYEFVSTAINYGACYPTSEVCGEYGQGSSAIISYVADAMSEAGFTCTVATATTTTATTATTTTNADATVAPVTTNGDSDATTTATTTTNGDSNATISTVTSTNESTSSAAASSMVTSFSVATIAAAVGTVMYL